MFVSNFNGKKILYFPMLDNHDSKIILCANVPAGFGKRQGAKEIGHNLARERPKFGHNLVRKQHKIGHSLERE